MHSIKVWHRFTVSAMQVPQWICSVGRIRFSFAQPLVFSRSPFRNSPCRAHCAKTAIKGSHMKKVLAVATVTVMGSLILFGLSVLAQSQSASSAKGAGVTYQVTAVVMAKAMNPMPGPNAREQSTQRTIGKRRAMVKTSMDNSFWIEEIDMDGSGNPV